MKVYILKEYPLVNEHLIQEAQIVGVITRRGTAEIWSNSDDKSCVRTKLEFEVDDPELLARIAKEGKIKK